MVAASENLNPVSVALDEQERLLRLFSNRVALKKAYSELRQRERDLSKTLEGAERRRAELERKLGYLEDLLTDEQTAQSTMLFYQLRGLWRRSHQHLKLAANQMATRISGKRTVEMIERWRQDHAERIAHLEQQLVTEKASILAMRQLLRDLEAQRVKARFPWHWWKRRRLRAEQHSVTEDLRRHVANHDETLARARALRVERPPADRSLPVSDQRVINLHLLAMAQFMTQYFESRGELASKARAAFHREAGAIEYGDDAYCRKLIAHTEKTFQNFRSFTASEQFTAIMRNQVQWLAKRASYADDQSAMPEPFDTDPLNMIDEARDEEFTPVSSLLGNDQWSISGILLFGNS